MVSKAFLLMLYGLLVIGLLSLLLGEIGLDSEWVLWSR